jgi:hypothetical protein
VPVPHLPEFFINFALSLIAGAIGWGVSNLVIMPWHTNYRSGFLEGSLLADEWKQAAQIFRGLSCKLRAQYDSFWPWHKWFEFCRGYKIDAAIGSLIGFANSDGDWATVYGDETREALKLKRSISDSQREHFKRKVGLIKDEVNV